MQNIPLAIAPTYPEPQPPPDQAMENAVLELREQLCHIFDPSMVIAFDPEHEWADAEFQVITSPPVSLEEDQQVIVLHIGVPGIGGQYLHVSAGKDQVLVEAEVDESHLLSGLGHQVQELTVKRLSRVFKMPEPIDFHRTEARLDGCILTIRAGKWNPPLPPDAFLP